MAKQVIKFWDKIIVVLLGVVGVVSSGCGKLEYGVIAADYEIKGTVTNKAKKQIQNIQVVKLYNEYGGDTLYTDSKGKFHFKFHGHSHRPLKFKIEDIDGEANGGEFETQEIEVKFTQDDKMEEDKFAKTINIELEKKK